MLTNINNQPVLTWTLYTIYFWTKHRSYFTFESILKIELKDNNVSMKGAQIYWHLESTRFIYKPIY